MTNIRLSLFEVNFQLHERSPANVISLDAAGRAFNVEEAEHKLKWLVAVPFVWTFIGITIVVTVAIIVLGVAEWYAVENSRHIERIVDSYLIMSVLGATTLQLGSVMYLIAKSVFVK